MSVASKDDVLCAAQTSTNGHGPRSMDTNEEDPPGCQQGCAEEANNKGNGEEEGFTLEEIQAKSYFIRNLDVFLIARDRFDNLLKNVHDACACRSEWQDELEDE